MKQTEMNTPHMVSRYGSLRTQLVIEGLLVGVFAGLVSVLYRFALEQADAIRNAALAFSAGNPLRMAGWFAVLIGLALLVTWLLKWEPMISGSGIPQVEAEIAGYIRPNWYPAGRHGRQGRCQKAETVPAGGAFFDYLRCFRRPVSRV